MATNCGVIRQIRGQRGPAGADGENGIDGINAYTSLTSQFTMPAENGTAVASVNDARWIAVGQILYLQGAGYLKVTATSNTTATLRNVENTASSLYAENVAPGTIVAIGSKLSPAGIQGPAGSSASAGAPTAASYLTRVPEAGLSGETAISSLGNGLLLHTGSGNLSAIGQGTGDVEIPIVDEAGGLDAGELLRATASGIESVDAATGRTTLGLGSMATQDSNNVTITGGSITGISGLTAGFVKEYALYQNQQSSGTGGGNFASGGFTTVPLNTEVSDSGAIGTLSSNQVTLGAGSYRVRWAVPGYSVNRFQSRLYNVSTAAVIGLGSVTSAPAAASASAVSVGEARFTLGGTQTIRIEAQCETTNANGFGLAASFGTEAYGYLVIEKEGA